MPSRRGSQCSLLRQRHAEPVQQKLVLLCVPEASLATHEHERRLRRDGFQIKMVGRHCTRLPGVGPLGTRRFSRRNPQILSKDLPSCGSRAGRGREGSPISCRIRSCRFGHFGRRTHFAVAAPGQRGLDSHETGLSVAVAGRHRGRPRHVGFRHRGDTGSRQ